MSLVPHPRIPFHVEGPSAAPLMLAAVIVATLLLAVIVALIQALGG